MSSFNFSVMTFCGFFSLAVPAIAESTIAGEFSFNGLEVGQATLSDVKLLAGFDFNKMDKPPYEICMYWKEAKYGLSLFFDSKRDHVFSGYAVQRKAGARDCYSSELIDLPVLRYIEAKKDLVLFHFGEDQLSGSNDRWEYKDESILLNFNPEIEFTREIKHKDGDINLQYFLRGKRSIDMLVFSIDNNSAVSRIEISNSVEPLYSIKKTLPDNQ